MSSPPILTSGFAGAVLLLVAIAFVMVSPSSTSAAPAIVHETSCGGDLGTNPVPNEFCSFAGTGEGIEIGPNSCNFTGACVELGNGVKINAAGDVALPGSCNGNSACAGLGDNAVLGAGSCLGEEACINAGGNQGKFSIGNGSCIGQLACRMAGSGAAFSVGDGSCDGGRSCDSSGVKSGDGDAGFEAGDGSCIGGGACGAAGSSTGAGNAGFKAGYGSCLGIGACDAAGATISASNGRFEAENNSCVGDMACQNAGFDPGGGVASFSIGNFSCNTDGNFTECQAEIANIGDCEFNDPPGLQECMPDVGVGLSCEPAEVAQGSDLTCRIDVLNQSFGQAPNATMSTATPPGTTFVALTVPPAWTCPVLPAVGGTGAIECDPTLDSNSLHTFVLVLNVNPGTPEGTEITLGVTVDADGDTNPANNSASATVTVVAGPEEPEEPGEPAEPAEPSPTPAPCCPLDVDTNNTNTYVISLDNDNANTNANGNANENENENTNINQNANTNTNAQDQANQQSQDNANDQTNNIAASPEVIIRR